MPVPIRMPAMPRTQIRPDASASQALVCDALARVTANQSLNLGDLPEDAANLVRQLLQDYAAGRQPRVIACHAEVSTFEAADLLNVSRPHLISLIEKGAIPFHRIGTHRRMKLSDVMAYKEAKDRAADAAMDELVTEAQSLKLGY